MRREKGRPTYDLEEAKRLSRTYDSMSLNRRIGAFLQNRYGIRKPKAFVSKLICSITPADFLKSEELEIKPGVWADVYQGVQFEGEEWYVKFFIDNDDIVQLSVMSAVWDGYIH